MRKSEQRSGWGVFSRWGVFSGIIITVAILLAWPAVSQKTPSANQNDEGGRPMALKLSSPAFSHHEAIPKKYTCDGQDLSPPLSWSAIPPGTKSLALIVDDPDAPDPKAPKMTWVHWVLYNIPPSVAGLPEGMPADELPAGTKEGLNSWKRGSFGGPCPPIGRHRYFHKLYALDVVLPDRGTMDKDRLESAMKDHILDRAELVGTYKR